MALLDQETVLHLWQNTIQSAESRCDIALDKNLESYLISLLIRYSNKPEIVQQLFAKAYLEALHEREHCRTALLQNVGDQCLLFAGLFPQQAKERNVKISYFVNIGRSAYSTISKTSNDLFWELALQFVALMDVLQSVRSSTELELLPLEAYEQWDELGSQRALQVLQTLTQGLPLKKSNHFD